MEQKTSGQDIDLLELLSKCYRTLKNNLILVILCPILGIAAGLILSSVSPETVKASMMVTTTLISEDEAKFFIEQLDHADSIHGLSKEQEKGVLRIDYQVSKGKEIDDIVPIYLKITTVITSKSLLPTLQAALIDYLNRAEPIRRHRREREFFYKEMIRKIDLELNALDQVKGQVNDKSKATFLDPSDLFAKGVELYEQRVKYEIGLEDVRSVHVVKGFESLVMNATWSRTFCALAGFLFGLILLAVVLFAKYFNGYYRDFERKSSN